MSAALLLYLIVTPMQTVRIAPLAVPAKLDLQEMGKPAQPVRDLLS